MGVPLVALNYQPQSPEQGYANMQQLQGSQQVASLNLQQKQQELQSGAMDLQMKQQAMKDQQTIMQAQAENDGDTAKTLRALRGKVMPQTYQALQKFDQESRLQLSQIADNDLKVQQDKHDRTAQLFSEYSKLAPDQKAKQWPMFAQRNNEINPEHPQDPNQPPPPEQEHLLAIGLQTQEQYLKQESDRRAQAVQAETVRHNQAEEAKPGSVTEASLAAKAVAGDKTAEAALKRLDQSKLASRPVTNNIMTRDDAKDIADAIENGDQPPTVQGLYRNAGPVRAELARRGVPLAKMETDWKATQRYVATLNGTQQTRLRQAVSTASDSLDKIEGLYAELQKAAPTGGFKGWNRAILAGAKQLPGRAGSLATNLDAQIADLTSELGNVYMGGNSPTDHALSLAGKNLSGDWNKQTFEEALKQTRLNIGIRKNSITHGAPVGLSGESDYFTPAKSDTAQPNAPKKVLSMANIQKAAQDHKVSVDEAKRQAEAAGYTIQ